MEEFGNKLLFAVFSLVLLWSMDHNHNIRLASGGSVAEDLGLSMKEKIALDKFKVRIIPQLPHEYMKHDIYLIRWLRAKNLNLDAAERMLKENLRWRKENRMDTIHSEDWSDMEEEYPYTADTKDKEGRPIWTINWNVWNNRKAALSGKGPRLLRWLNKILDDTTVQVIQAQERGLNVTRWTALMNFDGFSVPINACPLCLPVYAGIALSYENHFPLLVDEILIINAPPSFEIILSVMRPIFSPPTSKALKVFNHNKREWGPFLDKLISREERRSGFGGTKQD